MTATLGLKPKTRFGRFIDRLAVIQSIIELQSIRGREYGQISDDHYGAIASIRTHSATESIADDGDQLWLSRRPARGGRTVCRGRGRSFDESFVWTTDHSLRRQSNTLNELFWITSRAAAVIGLLIADTRSRAQRSSVRSNVHHAGTTVMKIANFGTAIPGCSTIQSFYVGSSSNPAASWNCHQYHSGRIRRN